MTIKNKELTNEMVAERLGWNYVHPMHDGATTHSLKRFGWFHKGEWKSYNPDLINSLDAQAEFLWPKMKPKVVADYVLLSLTFHGNLALAIAKEFMELEEKPCQKE